MQQTFAIVLGQCLKMVIESMQQGAGMLSIQIVTSGDSCN